MCWGKIAFVCFWSFTKCISHTSSEVVVFQHKIPHLIQSQNSSTFTLGDASLPINTKKLGRLLWLLSNYLNEKVKMWGGCLPVCWTGTRCYVNTQVTWPHRHTNSSWVDKPGNWGEALRLSTNYFLSSWSWKIRKLRMCYTQRTDKEVGDHILTWDNKRSINVRHGGDFTPPEMLLCSTADKALLIHRRVK